MTLLELPNRHHALHVLGVLVRDGELRFGQMVKATGHRDAEVARALEYLKKNHFIRSRTVSVQGERAILAYGITPRGQAAWESFEIYRNALRERSGILGMQEVQAIDQMLEV